MRLRRGAVTTALVGAMCTPAAARAQYVDERASIAVGATYARTITDQPFPTAFTLAGPSLSISPSFTLLADTPLTSETLVYNFSLSIPFTATLQTVGRPVNYANHLSFTSRVTLDDLTNLAFTLGFIESPVNSSAGAVGDSAEAPVDFVPPGVDYTISGNAQASLNRQLSELVTLSDSVGGTVGAPYDPLQVLPRILSVRNTTTLTRQFESDTVGLTLNLGYSYTTLGQAQNGTLTYPTQSLTNSLTASWSRPLLESLTLTVGAGAAQTVNLANPGTATPESQHWEPTVSFALSYHRDLAVAALSYSHAQSINLADGSDNFTDAVSLRFSIPAGLTGITSSATAGFNHNVAVGGILAAGGLLATPPDSTFSTDVTLLYRPPRWETASVSLRGQAARQIAGTSPTEMQSAAALASMNLTRLAVSLNLIFAYPSNTAVRTAPHLGPVVSAGAPEPAEILAPEPVHFEVAPAPP